MIGWVAAGLRLTAGDLGRYKPMNPENWSTLFKYHWHVTQKMLAGAAKLDSADYQEQHEYGHGSIHTILFHLLNTMRGWRLGFETGQQQPRLNAADFATLESLQTAFVQEQRAWDGLLASLSAEDIASDIALTTIGGASMRFPRWRVLQQLMLHGMQHHSELARLLTIKGQSPGDYDFIFFDERTA
jgi:uncharacterized damage-inducible protein DinB